MIKIKCDDEFVRDNIVNLLDQKKFFLSFHNNNKHLFCIKITMKDNSLDFIIEDNPLKHNKFVPGVKIPIKSKKNCNLSNPTVVVFAWNFFESIKKNNLDLSKNMISIKELERK